MCGCYWPDSNVNRMSVRIWSKSYKMNLWILILCHIISWIFVEIRQHCPSSYWNNCLRQFAHCKLMKLGSLDIQSLEQNLVAILSEVRLMGRLKPKTSQHVTITNIPTNLLPILRRNVFFWVAIIVLQSHWKLFVWRKKQPKSKSKSKSKSTESKTGPYLDIAPILSTNGKLLGCTLVVALTLI